MIAVLIFLAIVFSIGGWWLSRQRLMSKPWLEPGFAGVAPGTEAINLPANKVGLGVFLAVVGALFALFISAYFMRTELPDWRNIPMPRIIWLNTGLLVLASAALHCAVVAVRAKQLRALKLDLLACIATTLMFLFGQGMAWETLTAEGYFATSSPAYSFFLMLTGVHGIHIIGGLFVLTRTTRHAWTQTNNAALRASTELCATYWHFMLLVWCVVVVVLAGWANDFVDICRQLLPLG